MTSEREIWLPASVKKTPGHVKVGWNSIVIFSGRMYIKYTYSTIPHAVTTIGIRKDFFKVDPFVYYVNGRGEVYLTNIQFPHVTYFHPIGVKDDNTPVLFRKLHKLEWLFG
jgi:hypothetical protein